MCEKCAMYEQKVYAKTFLVLFRENWRKKRASVQDKTEKLVKITFPDLWNFWAYFNLFQKHHFTL